MNGMITNNLFSEQSLKQVVNSVCNTSEESFRLQRLLGIFIEVDKKLKKQCNEPKNNKRNSNNTREAI